MIATLYLMQIGVFFKSKYDDKVQDSWIDNIFLKCEAHLNKT